MAGREGRRRLPRRKRSSFHNVALLLILPIGGLLVFFAWMFVRSIVRIPIFRPPRLQASALPRVTVPRPPAHRGNVVLILDDVGFDHQPLNAAMAIDANVNFSVLPNAPHGVDFANALHARGFEVLCHLPMEPEGFPRISPGGGAVLTSMSDEEITRTTSANVASVPHARGVNNHMGSRATADRRVMRDVLSSLPAGMYFIDSRTSGASIGAAVARQMKIPTASRNVFLDDVQTSAGVRQQLELLRRTAEERGVAIGIGHMYPVTIAVLTHEAPRLRAEGFRFIRASEAVR